MTSTEVHLLRKIEDAERDVRQARALFKFVWVSIGFAAGLLATCSALTNGNDGWVAGAIVGSIGGLVGFCFLGFMAYSYWDADLPHEVTKARRDYEDYLTEQAERGR